MLNQCMEKISTGLLHACISSYFLMYVLNSVGMAYYFMLNQCMENIGTGLLHACISSYVMYLLNSVCMDDFLSYLVVSFSL